MSDYIRNSRSRFNPYTRLGRGRRDKQQGRVEESSQVNVSKDISHQVTTKVSGLFIKGKEAKEEQNSWFKITIPYGKTYDKIWLLGVLQQACALPFVPLKYYKDNYGRANFFVDNSEVATALKKISGTLIDSKDRKIIISTRPCPPPKPKYITEGECFHFKNCMEKRYNRAQQSMDLKSVLEDKDLISQKVSINLNWTSTMNIMIQITAENIPQLQSLDLSYNKLYKLRQMAGIHLKAPNLKILNLSGNFIRTQMELNTIKELQLESLWLKENPLCNNFKNYTKYFSAIRKYFPQLKQLDGKVYPPPTELAVEKPAALPPCKSSYFPNEDIKAYVLQFIQQYYACYDSEDRQGLLNAYHHDAFCSLSIAPTAGPNPASRSLSKYYKDNRNLKTLKEPKLGHKRLHHKGHNVLSFLKRLPRTQHVPSSIMVDIMAQTPTLLSFVINGVFKVIGQSSDDILAFTRVFVAVPSSNGGMLLTNDKQIIRDATKEEIERLTIPPTTESSSETPSLTSLQQELVQKFTTFSGMKPFWSQMCLQENNWHYEKATQNFLKVKAEGKIPSEAFNN